MIVNYFGFIMLMKQVINCKIDANFPNGSNPWFIRGGNYGNGANAGAFNFNNNNGNANTNNSARAVFLGALDYTIRRDLCYYLDNIKFHISNYLYNFGS